MRRHLLQASPDPKCFEPSVLHDTVIMKTNADKFRALRPIAYLNYWGKSGSWGALWLWIFGVFCCQVGCCFLKTNKQTQRTTAK